MPHRVYKYRLGFAGRLLTRPMPAGAKVLSVGWQPVDGLVMWALVNPDNPLEERKFHTFGTGHPVANPDSLEFVGSVQTPAGFVWHVFQELPPHLRG